MVLVVSQDYYLNKSKGDWSYFTKNFTSVSWFLILFYSALFSKLNSLCTFSISGSLQRNYIVKFLE